jgi:hypothetical protein
MKRLILVVLSMTPMVAFADDSEINGQLEMLSPNLEETSNGPELVELGQPVNKTSGEGATGQTRQRTVTITNDGEESAGNQRATDHNSSRSNKTSHTKGNDETHTGIPKSKAQDYNSSRPNKSGTRGDLNPGHDKHVARELDGDDDDDSVPVKEVSKD